MLKDKDQTKPINVLGTDKSLVRPNILHGHTETQKEKQEVNKKMFDNIEKQTHEKTLIQKHEDIKNEKDGEIKEKDVFDHVAYSRMISQQIKGNRKPWQEVGHKLDKDKKGLIVPNAGVLKELQDNPKGHKGRIK